jgi:peptidyl-prolyl cis-trans isomerase SurA
LALLLCSAATASAALAVKDPLDRIVAVVNDEVITELELNSEVESIKQQLQRQNTRMPSDSVLKRQLLERMILKRIQLQMAQRGHIKADDETVNRALDNIAAQNNLSLEQFRQALKNEGMDYTKFRENLRDEIILTRLQQDQVRNRIVITQQEIDNFLSNQKLRGDINTEYRLGHILIAVPEAASAEQIAAAQKKATEIVTKLRAGDDFAQTAIAVSDGQQALEGGDLGWRRAEALPTLFADWVTKHSEGNVSDAMRSPSGFHIIKLLQQRSMDAKHVVQQTHARHILLRDSEFSQPEEIRARLLKLRERLQAGEDFAKLAKLFSEDPGSASKGGDLGWVNPGEMVPVFEQTMDGLALNELSEPVHSRFGWHIVQVLARREHDNTDDIKRKKARQAILARKLDPAMQSWLRRLRDEAFVETRL